MFASLALALAMNAAVAATSTTSFPPLKRESVLEESIPGANPPIHLVRGAHIRFAPGQPTGLHRHPASVVGVVTEGSFKFQREGEPLRILKTGDSFFEPANHIILHFDNASGAKPAAIVAFYLTDSKDRPLIEMLDPMPAPRPAGH
jgi:quercetin dioxygenase-like cupin family protein